MTDLLRTMLMVICVCCVGISEIKAQQFSIKHYSEEDGFPRLLTVSMIQDSQGYLWAGCDIEGVARYDGSEFRFFKDSLFLGMNSTFEFFCDSRGVVWVSNFNGTFVYFEGKFQNPGAKIGFKQGYIRSFYEDTNNVIYLGYDNGDFAVFDGKKFTTYSAGKYLPGHRIGQISGDDDGNVWISTYGGGVYRFDGKRFTNYSFGEGDIPNRIWSVLVDNSGDIWASSLEDIRKFNGQAFHHWKGADSLAAPFSNYMLQDSRGRFWFVHLDQISLWDGKRVVIFGKQNFGNTAVTSVFEDDQKNIWFTSTKGLMRLENEWSRVSPVEVNAENMIKDLYIDSHDNIWTGTSMDGLVRYYNGTTEKDKPRFFDGVNFFSFCEEDQLLWIGTDIGLVRKQGSQYRILSITEGLYGKYVYDIVKDRNGNLIVATENGIYRYDGTVFTRIPVRKNNKGNFEETVLKNVFSLCADSLGNIWAGTEKGIFRVVQDHFESVFSSYVNSQIWEIVEYAKGDLWFATDGDGLIRWLNGRFVQYHVDDGLISNTILSLTKDCNDQLYCGSFKGINLIRPLENDAIEIKKYDQQSGMIDERCSPKTLIADNHGSLMYLSVSGLLSFHPGEINQKPAHYPTYVTGVEINDNSRQGIDFNQNMASDDKVILSLKHDQNILTFYHTAIYFRDSRNVKYECRLISGDSTRIQVTKNRNVTFSGLKPGKYSYELISLCDSVQTLAKNTPLFLVISSPFWLKWWFIMGIIFFAIGVVYFSLMVYKGVIRRKEARKNLIQKKIHELELRSLKAQMNPHFVFNSINSIQNLVIQEKAEDALKYLNQFGRLIRMTLDYSVRENITLQEDMVFLKAYLEMEKLRFKDKFDVYIEVDEELDTDFDRIPPMLIQVFIENAIKHGLIHRNTKGLLSVVYKKNNNSMICTITDNGVGRQRARELEKWKPHRYHAKGLALCRERIELLNLQYQMDALFQMKITDLFDNNKDACGTRVDVIIPLL